VRPDSLGSKPDGAGLEEAERLVILHVSDLHFGPPFVPRVGEELLRVASRLNPSVVVVSGDLTQRATRDQFEQARSFLNLLPAVPRIVVPGNHDVPLYRVLERLRRPHQLYKEIIDEDLNPVLRVPGATLVGLDSTNPRQAISNGRLTRSQLDACVGIFETAPPDDIRIVVTHHHLAQAPDALNDRTLRGVRLAMKRFIEMGVEIVLGGHLHRAFIGSSLDFFFGSHRDRGVTIIQSGTSTSRRGRGRERERNSFNLIEVSRDELVVTHFLFFEADEHFGPISRHVFPRHGRRLPPPAAVSS
jgi:3',5'-cyclic AMP phosphodiesterase CpdA